MFLLRRQQVEDWVLRQWRVRGLWSVLTRPGAKLFAAVLWARGLLYRAGLVRAQRLKAQVIVVGNVVAGGTGKTPVVMALVDRLLAQGWQVGVLARGYRAAPPTPVFEVQANSPAQAVGDEPLLVKQRTGVPVFIGRERAAAGQALLQAYPQVQVLVCDDGLQHLALARDIEIGVFDDRGVGNGLLQPAGPLREPWPRPLDFVLHTGQRATPMGLDTLPVWRARRSLSHQAQAVLKPAAPRPLRDWQGLPVAAVAGIAQPEVFFQALRDQGLNLVRCYPRPDHHDFLEVSHPHNELRQENLPLFCTEKDAVKLAAWWSPADIGPVPDLWTVPLTLEIDPAFWTAIETRLQRTALSSGHGQQTA